jgi:hypothetical protein
MAPDFKPGDHVEWNSEAGRVRGAIQKKVTSEIVFKGYKRHASREEPQYIIKSDKTDHLARVGDLFMSLIYTCQLNEANPFDYLTQLQRHADQLVAGPQLWLPWNYREALAPASGAQPN